MGDLITFRTAQASFRTPKEGSARILFFTGVRYQRMTDGEPDGGEDEKSGKPSKGRRPVSNRGRRRD